MDKMSKEALAVKKAEQAFDRKRRTIGLFGGPLLAILVFLTPIEALTVPGHKLLAIMVLVALWWITEPVPIPVTSLIGPTLAVVTGVVSVKAAFAAFANPMIFLFMGVEKFSKIDHLAIVADQKAAAKAEARAILEDARRTADQVFRELSDMRKQARKQGGDIQAENQRRADLRHRLNEAEGRLGAKAEPEAPPMLRPAQKGDTVTILKTGTQASVLSVNKDGVLQLQAGILRITAKQEEVRVVEGETQAQKEAKKFIQRSEHQLRSLGAKAEVDLRGMTTDEAEGVLAQFLDRAILANLTQITVIHGKGTGAVRKAVHAYLKRAKGVASFRLGRYGEGETGVTIVELK